jgi:ABC-2 type transport system permease protein
MIKALRLSAFRKLLLFVRIAGVQELSYRATLTGRLCFFIVILLVFSSLWRTIFAVAPLSAYGPAAMLWYLFVTECITLSAPRLITDVEDDVRSGNIAYLMARPLSYPAAIVARGCGILLVVLSYKRPVPAFTVHR